MSRPYASSGFCFAAQAWINALLMVMSGIACRVFRYSSSTSVVPSAWLRASSQANTALPRLASARSSSSFMVRLLSGFGLLLLLVLGGIFVVRFQAGLTLHLL